MELAMQEQFRERQEMEKKMQKLIKTMDHFERAKREEAAPLIEVAFQRCLAEEKLRHERDQQLEVELSRERHDGDLKEKYRLARVMEHKMEFQERVVKRREAEYNRMKAERAEQLSQDLRARKEDRETKRKMLYYIKIEEERLNRLREEEEARKREEAERHKKEEAERRAKLNEIAFPWATPSLRRRSGL